MMVRRSVPAIGFVAILALSINLGTTHAQDGLTRAQGLMITRMMLSIEFNTHTNGVWRDLSNVMKLAQDPARDPASGAIYFAPDLATAKIVDSSTVTVFDYTLRLTLTNDKKHYQMSLTPTTPKTDDRMAWFTDDRGIIYIAQTISNAPTPNPPPDSLTRQQGLSMMRGVMTLEVTGFDFKSKGFGDLAEVVSASERDPAAWKMVEGEKRARIVEEIDANTAPVLDYTLLVTLSDNKKHFQVSLTPSVPKADAPEWFCDDRGVIYIGKPIG